MQQAGDGSFTNIRKRRPFSSVQSRRLNGEKKVDVKKADDSDGSDYDEEDVYLMKKEQEFYPVRGHPGMWYKVGTQNSL